jgi:hypothetical protein
MASNLAFGRDPTAASEVARSKYDPGGPLFRGRQPCKLNGLTRSRGPGGMPRRLHLTGVAGSVLGALVVDFGFGEAGAIHFSCIDVGQRCKDRSEGCSDRCKRGRCRALHVGQCTAAKGTCLTGIEGCGYGRCDCYLTTGV